MSDGKTYVVKGRRGKKDFRTLKMKVQSHIALAAEGKQPITLCPVEFDDIERARRAQASLRGGHNDMEIRVFQKALKEGEPDFDLDQWEHTGFTGDELNKILTTGKWPPMWRCPADPHTTLHGDVIVLEVKKEVARLNAMEETTWGQPGSPSDSFTVKQIALKGRLNKNLCAAVIADLEPSLMDKVYRKLLSALGKPTKETSFT
jgi:hypothetical protein